MNKNLHVAFDDKFIDYIINIANDLKISEDRFVIFGALPSRHVKNTNVEFLDFGREDFWAEIGDVNKYNNVFIHFVGLPMAKFVNRLPKDLTIVWCFWGGEAFSLSCFEMSHFESMTSRYVSLKKHLLDKKNFDFKWSYLFHPFRFYYAFNAVKKHNDLKSIERHDDLKSKAEDESTILKALRRMNYFGHFIPNDYDLLKTKLEINARMIPFHYASVEKMIEGVEIDTTRNRKNILIGNSDTPTNNHLDVFDKLNVADLGEREIICPLSYNKGEYAHYIASVGKEKFGANFNPLLEFMDKVSYNTLTSSVSIAIMYHIRSQAAGNVVVCMWFGVKVYMHSKSTLYQMLKEEGAPVYAFDLDFDSKKSITFNPLTEEETRKGQEVLLRLFSYENQKKKLARLLTL